MTKSARSLLVVVFITLGAAGLSAKEPASTVKCTDGTSSEGGKGACSHHGGVAKGAPEPGQNPPRAVDVGGVVDSVKCKDGTSSPHGGKGACSGHGGIDRAPANDNVVAPVTAGTDRPTSPPKSADLGGVVDAVKCQDGTSAPHGGKGACSHHGGIDKEAANEPSGNVAREELPATPRPPVAADKTTMPGPASTGAASAKATANCKDGTLSYSLQRSGACSHHGGVASWMEAK
jgi:Protein of unknown function (DUF3761)